MPGEGGVGVSAAPPFVRVRVELLRELLRVAIMADALLGARVVVDADAPIVPAFRRSVAAALAAADFAGAAGGSGRPSR